MKTFLGILLSFLLSSAVTAVYGQDNQLLDTFSREKIPVLIEPMQFPGDIPPGIVERIQQIAYLSVERHWHFQVINHSQEENTGTVDPEYIFQLSLEPLVDDLSQSDVVDSAGVLTRTNYTLASGLSLNLRITSIVTGELKYSREIKCVTWAHARKNFLARNFIFDYGRIPDWKFPKVYPFPQSPEEEAAILQEQKNKLLLEALDAFPGVWQQALLKVFPAPLHLVSVLDGSSKKPKVIVVDGGENFGLKKNQALELFTFSVYEAMGQTFVREKKLGYYYPKQIEPSRSVGNIFGGRKEVGQALARGEQVFCRFLE